VQVPDVFFTIIPDQLKEHKGAIHCIGFPPFSSETSVSDTIVSCSKDGTTCKWILEEKKVVIRPMLSERVDKFRNSVAVAMSHDCKHISSNIQSRLPRKSRLHLGEDMGIWDVETGRLLFNPIGDQIFDVVSFSKDDTQMVAASLNGFHLWDVKTGEKVVGPFQMGWQIGHSTSFPIYSVAFAHNDHLILSGLENGFINITDIKHPYCVSRCIGHCHSAPVVSIAVKQDKDQFVSGSKDGTVIVWNLEQKQIGPFTICWVAEGHQKFKCSNDPIKSVTVSPNNDLVAAGSTNGIVMIWDLNKLDGVPHVCIGNESGVRCISFAHDMKQIASGHENGIICVWKI
jgi:WD40 repeat protein